MQSPPRALETDRLVLRLPRPGDIDDIFRYASDAEVTALLDWTTLVDPEQVHEFVDRTDQRWNDRSEFTWVIAEKPSDRVIGAIALRLREEDCDFGYVLNRRNWGHGIAVEASRAVLDWARGISPTIRVWATCDVENYRSARVLEKLGFEREGTLVGNVVRPNVSGVPRDSYRYGLRSMLD